MKNEPVNITQEFSVSKAELFTAWTDEAALKSWWKPTGRTLSNVENDIKDGGQVVYEFEDGDDTTGQLTIKGEYQTAIPEEKLVYTWNWIVDNKALENGNYLLTVEFKDQDGGSQISITQEKQSEEEGIHPHEEGWKEGLESLKTYLER
jgi:uncharacterized protein YndB with AHSA1/START domain